jgi:hypothetical protein
MKVEDWQRYQQDAEMGVKAEHAGGGGSSSKRDSRKVNVKAEGVPFPDDDRGRRSKGKDI